MGGHWSYKVKLKDSDGKTIAKFDLDQGEMEALRGEDIKQTKQEINREW